MGNQDLYKASLSRAMAICSKREYCREDIRSKLRDWGVDEKGIHKTIDTLTTEKFIDERRYAKAFTNDKFHYNKWGRIKIAASLRMKKIPSEIISEALESIDNDLYEEILKHLLSSHRKTIKAGNQYELKGKLLRFALSRGFENGLVYGILNLEE